jgi:hypothetical protein
MRQADSMSLCPPDHRSCQVERSTGLAVARDHELFWHLDLGLELGDPVLQLLQMFGGDTPSKDPTVIASSSQLGHQGIQIPLDRQQDLFSLGCTVTGPRQPDCRLSLVYSAICLGT